MTIRVPRSVEDFRPYLKGKQGLSYFSVVTDTDKPRIDQERAKDSMRKKIKDINLYNAN